MWIAGQPRAVPVVVGPGVAKAPPLGMPRWGDGVMVADRAVYALHSDALDSLMSGLVDRVAEPLELDAGEDTKDAANLVNLWSELDRRHLDRSSVLVVVGGGSVLDVGAFLAATWLRGIDLVVVPSTLLAQVDAGLGGKCGVNLGHAKNRVGAIWQPRVILADVGLLATLPEEEVASGMGEVVKTAVLSGPELTASVKRLAADPSSTHGNLGTVVHGCLQYKAAVVEEDERESGRRAVLNLGHTVGHVIESTALAAGAPIPHGVAVAMGLRAETEALCESGATCAEVSSLLDSLNLPARSELTFQPEAVRDLLLRDKKRRQDEFVVPVLRELGEPQLVDVKLDKLIEACRSAMS